MSKKEFKYFILTDDMVILDENPKSDWVKAIVRISWNDKPPAINIRNLKLVNDGDPILGKGISLSDEETDVLVDALLDKGYGSKEAVERSLENKSDISFIPIELNEFIKTWE